MKSTAKRASLDSIKQFMNQKHVAVAGVSRTKTKFGNSIFKELKKKDYIVYPVHPVMESYEGVKCFPDIKSLPPEVTALIISTKPEKTIKLIQDAVEKNIKNIWVQQGAQHEDAVKFTGENGVNLIQNECVLMFAEPVVSVHRFHRGINKLFGKYPKPVALTH